MQNYGTAAEKAVEWGISIRHVQYLCRTGKIEGAVKRVGAWFIPDDAPIPVKNTKSNAADFKFAGTKDRIFNSAIELFLLRGFDSVSLKDISVHAGIRQSTMYGHFSSTREILDTIYDYYCHYFIKERPNLEDMEFNLKNKCLTEIINLIRYDFKADYQQKMSDITLIIFQRIGIDDRAREIAKSLIVGEGIRYVEDIFDRLVELGKLPVCDTHQTAVFINGIRIFTLFHWLVDPSCDNHIKLAEDEKAMFNCAAKFLTGLIPGTNTEEHL